MELEDSNGNYQNRDKDNLPWVDKYRPRELTDLISHKKIIKTLENYMKNENFPNLLMYGSAGTGKTSTIKACARKMYKNLFKYMVLELNASDERGIKTVRETIKNFAESSPPVQMNTFYFKLVILDEADSMTKDAQAALRRMIEKYSKTTRFCFICNYATNIIPAIQSRCTKFKFKHVPLEDSLQKIKDICQNEKFIIDEDVLKELIIICEGDMRKTINLLQNFYLMDSSHENGSAKLTVTNVYNKLGVLSPDVVHKVFTILLNEDFENGHTKICRLLQEKDADLGTLIPHLTEMVQKYDFKNPQIKINFFKILAEVEERVSLALDRDLTLDYLIASFFEARNKE
jgi:replication factor C subunit 3/5